MTSKRRRLLGAIATLALAAQAAVWHPAWADTPAGQPYALDVWADMLFDTTGKLDKLEVPDAAQYPQAFVERVKKQLATAKIPPVKDDTGAPASFQSGMRVSFLITPGTGEGGAGGTVRILGIGLGPRPIKRYAASAPEDLPSDTPTAVTVRCEVGADGRCDAVKVLDADGTSEVLRRWAVASMRGWVFEPQRVNGKAMPGESVQKLVLDVQDVAPRDFRDPRKLQGR